MWTRSPTRVVPLTLIITQEESVPCAFQCPITHDVMQDPDSYAHGWLYTYACGHIYGYGYDYACISVYAFVYTCACLCLCLSYP